jgi:hypothetical protein
MIVDIGAEASEYYAKGTPPIDFAEANTALLIRIHREVTQDAGTWPSYTIELTDNGLARKILGDLLDAGWTCPAGAADQVSEGRPA